jgi:hypothetical protein
MAITVNGGKFIASVVKKDIQLGDLVVIGRQGLYTPKSVLNGFLASASRASCYSLESGDHGLPREGEWADDVFWHFGATALTVLDASTYEGANRIHDLNQKLPDELEGRFDCLIDGGSLEHVFNVPEALSSYMKMVKVGGHVILLDMPATNCCGHGFYQFSPAIFWQVFSRENGYRIIDMVMTETRPFAPFWRVVDPAEYGGRVELVHNNPCHIYVVAQKCREFAGFGKKFPVQDDYAQAWAGKLNASAKERPRLRSIAGLARWLLIKVSPKIYWMINHALGAWRRSKSVKLGGRQAPYARVL